MKYGLIGEHLSHSYSKLIQEKLLDNYTYDIHPIPKDELDSFMKEKDFQAINVTIPYKKDVIPYLDHLDNASQKIGAVNTIVNKDGVLYGYNTDYYGFYYMVEKHNVSLAHKKVLVLGNGGASQAIQAVVRDQHAKEMIVTDIILSDSVISLDEVYKKHTDAQIIINTTPCGMYPKVDTTAIDISQFKHCEAVFDCVYNPMDTKFTLQAKESGITVAVTGLEMLVAQAKKALEYFKDIQIKDSEIDRIYREILKDTSNLILVSDNQSLAKEIAHTLSKELVLDEVDIKAYENKKVILVSDKDKDNHYSKLISNGFIIQEGSKEEILNAFDHAIHSF